jgi:7,8-dihydropterin-6-yl-methyl-4-(beta-D-ribofuranosyl)aminobenzene 5'-phosphate synthase
VRTNEETLKKLEFRGILKMKLTIVYDNNAEAGLKSGWGFSCLIEAEEKILFDTGDDGKKLLFNLKKLGIEPESIDKVIISHNHWDHNGGLKAIQEINSNAEVIHPETFAESAQISSKIYTTGALVNQPKEQALIVETDKGNIVVTGCAHPGLGNILQVARKLGKVYGVIGGFHDFLDFKQLEGIELIGPCHCTKYIEQIGQKYPRQFKKVKAGTVIEI